MVSWSSDVPVWDDSVTYDDYLESTPSREDLRQYATPVLYWEVQYPGCELRPYPKFSSIVSRHTGLWEATCKAHEDAIREHLADVTGGNPDKLKLTEADIAEMRKPVGEAQVRYCHDCPARYASIVAANLHESLNDHHTHQHPKER